MNSFVEAVENATVAVKQSWSDDMWSHSGNAYDIIE